ncbi:MAG: 4-hydroxy-tetrahydrodipicolinate synthase [Chloroflexi bacterium]|jgi:4-hydroxy-tetrahydrodipicolinate synthase|nr:4-hydroxy-tetrahydrodipicolinate synthase [Chloroflexota bacterium]MBT4141523.1 4-hydroxy-tetrahydrodipicolinate synthase [Chloroflexota bacterium]MBT4341295.1 4-hydroxy-tetrahydrodipicolinate synthase [Chloroflexota bacterium]MBT5477094.1 4-hydroxy-tetrahydrodipicolinate synthase [Chloroflexota bacterium]
MAELGRLLTAMVTPFTKEGDVDYARARELAKALLKSGSDGLVIGGTTGEAPAMGDDELLRLFAEVKEAIGEDGAVIAGTTNNNTRGSIALSREAEKAGVDALLLTVPAYNKPTMGGLYQHFTAIADAVSIPGILYNVPSRTALNMDSATTLRLADVPNIVGVKEASSDPDQIAYVIKDSPEGFRVWSGNDNEILSTMAVGGYGIVSVAGNIISGQIQKMMGLLLEGDVEAAAAEHLRLLPIFNALFYITNPIPIRYAMNRSGFSVGPARLPMVPEPSELAVFSAKFDPIMDQYAIDLAD